MLESSEVLPVSDQDEVLGEESDSAQSSEISKQDPQDDAERTV